MTPFDKCAGHSGIVDRLNSGQMTRSEFIEYACNEYFGTISRFIEHLDRNGDLQGGSVDPDDIALEVLVKLTVRVRKTSPFATGRHLENWLFKVAFTTFIDTLRQYGIRPPPGPGRYRLDAFRLSKKPAAGETDPFDLFQIKGFSPEEELLRQEEQVRIAEARQAFRPAVGLLPRDYEIPFVMRLSGQLPKAIASSLGRSPSWASVRITRAKRMVLNTLTAAGHVVLADSLREHPIDAWGILLEDDEELEIALCRRSATHIRSLSSKAAITAKSDPRCCTRS